MPMTCVPLGERVRQRMDDQGLSYQAVQQKSGGRVSAQTVLNLAAHGAVPSIPKLTILAITLGDDPNEYLRLAGFDYAYTGPRNLELARVRRSCGAALAA